MLPALSFSYLYCIKFFIKINIYLKLFKLFYGAMSITKGGQILLKKHQEQAVK